MISRAISKYPYTREFFKDFHLVLAIMHIFGNWSSVGELILLLRGWLFDPAYPGFIEA